MHILIKDFKGFNTSFEIEPSETIEQIKEKYLKFFNVPKEAQNLLLNEVNLEDNKKIIDYNVNEGTILKLNLNENYIIINARNIMGKIIPFYLRNSDNIKALKQKIEEREGIPQNIQKLILKDGDKNLELEDNKTFQDYDIRGETQILIGYNK